MDLLPLLLERHSKVHTFEVVDVVINNESFFQLLVEIASSQHPVAAGRAAWVMNEIIRKSPDRFLPYQQLSIEILSRETHPSSVLRHLLNLWDRTPVPEAWQGRMIDLCIGFMTNPLMGSAIKAYSISILQPICMQYPELGEEIVSLVKARIDYEKPAFRSRANYFLKKIAQRSLSNK